MPVRTPPKAPRTSHVDHTLGMFTAGVWKVLLGALFALGLAASAFAKAKVESSPDTTFTHKASACDDTHDKSTSHRRQSSAGNAPGDLSGRGILRASLDRPAAAPLCMPLPAYPLKFGLLFTAWHLCCRGNCDYLLLATEVSLICRSSLTSRSIASPLDAS